MSSTQNNFEEIKRVIYKIYNIFRVEQNRNLILRDGTIIMRQLSKK